MAKTAEDRRRRRRKNRSRKKRTTVLDLPDHLFEHVLLRLGPSACLVRAAAACKRWCRVVADAGFLARVLSAHPHALRIGDYHGTDGPVFVPFPSSPVDSRRFLLDDLVPDNGKEGYWWEMVDSRRSLHLLATWTLDRCETLVVCEPLTRRRQGILLPQGYDYKSCLGMFLVDREDAGRTLGMSNFRIIVAFHQALAVVFTSGSDGGWRLLRSEAISEVVNIDWSYDNDDLVGRANGFIYWGIKDGGGSEVLALNETTAEYSVVKFPVEIWGTYVRNICASWILKREDGALRIVRLLGNDLKVFVQRLPCREDDKNIWILEKELLGLAEATVGMRGREDCFFKQGARIVTANDEYILLTPILTPFRFWLFSVELETMLVKREDAKSKYQWTPYRCELPYMAAGLA